MRPIRMFDPVSEFNALRREIDKAFDSVRGITLPRNAFLPGRSPRSYPQVNIVEDDDHVYVEALAPGLDPENIHVTVLRNQLTITGAKEGLPAGINSEKIHRSERASGSFSRVFTLPSEVDDSKVSAEYKGGILRINLPKTEAAKPKKIDVTVS